MKCFISILLVFGCILPSHGDSWDKRILRGKMKPLPKMDQFGINILNIMNKNQNITAIIDVDTGVHISYKKMMKNAIRCAIWLKTHISNVTQKDTIALVSDSTVNEYIPVITALFEGIILSSWPADLNIYTARYFLNLIQPKAIFCIESVVDVLRKACDLEKQWPTLVLLDDPMQKERNSINRLIDSVPSEMVKNYKPTPINNSKDIGLILFTSGSSGYPKGAAHSYSSMLHNFVSKKIPLTYPNQRGRPTLMWYSAPSWATWQMCFYSGLMEVGVRIFHRKFQPLETIKIINKYQVNFFLVNPAEMAGLLHSSQNKRNSLLDSLEDVVTGGSILRPKIFDAFKEKVLKPNVVVRSTYGMTEMGVLAHLMTKVGRKNTTAQAVGFPNYNTEIKIIDEHTGELLGPFEAGEICVRKPYMFSGYYKNLKETRKAIDKEGWLHTGDRGYYDQHGELYFVERIKDLMKFRNHQVIPSEIEGVLLQHPDVVEAAVVPIPDSIDGEHPMAFVVKRAGSKVTEDELLKLSFTLGKYKGLWGGVKFLDALPRTPSKKVSKIKLKEIAKTYENKNLNHEMLITKMSIFQ